MVGSFKGVLRVSFQGTLKVSLKVLGFRVEASTPEYGKDRANLKPLIGDRVPLKGSISATIRAIIRI